MGSKISPETVPSWLTNCGQVRSGENWVGFWSGLVRFEIGSDTDWADRESLVRFRLTVRTGSLRGNKIRSGVGWVLVDSDWLIYLFLFWFVNLFLNLWSFLFVFDFFFSFWFFFFLFMICLSRYTHICRRWWRHRWRWCCTRCICTTRTTITP